MRRHSYRITLTGLLSAVLWSAICMTAFATDYKEFDHFSMRIAVFFIRYASPFAAVGALFGRARWGAVLGVIGVGLFVILYLVAADLGLIEFE
jgi:hypothetical protein